METTYKVEHLPGTKTSIGEGPFYDVKTNNLYWVDIVGGQLSRMDMAINRVFTADTGGDHASFIVPVDSKDNNQFIIGACNSLLLINWNGFSMHVDRVLAEIPIEGVRFNDAKTDSRGRLYLGTMISDDTGTVFDFSKRVGSLYRFTMAEGLVKLKTDVGFSNGIAFDEKENKMYYVDSYDLNVKVFAYDVDTGNISDEKVLIDLTSFGTPKTNVPDGLNIDCEGNLYVAMFGGSKILKINTATGKVINEIPMPVNQITSMAFGGENLDTLFVTTAGKDVVSAQSFPAGCVFKVTNLGVRGTPMTKFSIAK